MGDPDSEADNPSTVTRLLCGLARFGSTRPRTTICLILWSACAAITFSALGMQFKTDRADLINPEAEFHQRWLDFTASFGDASDMLFVVQGSSPAEITPVIDQISERLQADPATFRNILSRIDATALRSKGLQYLSPDRLETLLQRLDEYRPVLEGHWALVRLPSLIARLQYQLSQPSEQPAGGHDPLGELTLRLIESLNRFAADDQQFVSPWPSVLDASPAERDLLQEPTYLLSDDQRVGFLKAAPNEQPDQFSGPITAVKRAREIIAEVAQQHPRVKIGLTGIPVLECDEMLESQSDMLTATIVSFIGVSLLMFVGFRGLRHPLLVIATLAVGMSWAFGYTTLSIGHLNILSVSFAAILIGLGIDFGIHYLATYLQLRHHCASLPAALQRTAQTVGAGIATAAVTTALAFYCATLTPFLGVAELGVIAGGGILLCALATFLFLPALVTLADARTAPGRFPTPFRAQWLRVSLTRHPNIIAGLSGAVIVGLSLTTLTWQDGHLSSRMKYDSNLLNLQADGVESVEVQRDLFEHSGQSLLFAVSISMPVVPQPSRRIRARFGALPTVSHVYDPRSWLPATPFSETRLQIQAVRAHTAHLPDAAPRFTDANPVLLGEALESLLKTVNKSTIPQSAELSGALNRFLDRFAGRSLADQIVLMQGYEYRMLTALLRQFQELRSAAELEPITLDDFPPELVSRFVSPDGRWLLQIQPQQQVWDGEPLQRFVADIRSVDAHATGTPVQNFEASRQIRDSYMAAAWYALAVTCVVLLVDFLKRDQAVVVLLPPLMVTTLAGLTLMTRGSNVSPGLLTAAYVCMSATIAAMFDVRGVRDTFLALLPPVTGGTMACGLLAMMGEHLNPANMIMLPLVLGIGVDDGVHVIHDFRRQRGRYCISGSTVNAIVLTSLTSMIGFGSMMLASHRGLYTVGLTLVIGVGSCLFVSVWMVPDIITILGR